MAPFNEVTGVVLCGDGSILYGVFAYQVITPSCPDSGRIFRVVSCASGRCDRRAGLWGRFSGAIVALSCSESLEKWLIRQPVIRSMRLPSAFANYLPSIFQCCVRSLGACAGGTSMTLRILFRTCSRE